MEKLIINGYSDSPGKKSTLTLRFNKWFRPLGKDGVPRSLICLPSQTGAKALSRVADSQMCPEEEVRDLSCQL